VIRRAVELHWPTLLVGAACAGLAAANWWRLSTTSVVLAAAVGACVVVAAGRAARVALLALALAFAGSWWGGLRLDALDRSVLAARVGEWAPARVVVTGPARRSRFVVRVPAEVRHFDGESLRERVLLELPLGRAPPQGAVIELRARPVEPRGPETGFDERGWLARRGVHVVVRGRDWRVVGRRGGIGGVSDRLRAHVAAALASGARGERRAVLAGVVLGEDEGIDEELQDDFRASGLYHLLAVSGQNVGFLAGGTVVLAWLLGIPRVLGQLGVLATVGAYVLAVGWQPSVVRAGVAGCLVSLAWLASRTSDPWHFMALGALVLLVWTPASLLEPGFQLSFAAVTAIFVTVPRAGRMLEGYPVPRKPALLVIVSLACGLATAPILWLRFGAVPLWSVPANALAEPAMPLVLGLGLAAAVVEPVLPSAAVALAWLAGWCAAWLALCARAIASLPFAQVSSPAVLALLGAVTAAAVVLSRLPAYRRRELLGATAAAALVAGVAWWALRPATNWAPPAGLRVTFLDVGQGDSALLEVPEGAVLVDEGPPEAEVARQLRRLGIHSLSAIVLTHPQRDHVGGAADVLRQLHVAQVLEPAIPSDSPEQVAALAAARQRSVPVEVARAGSVYRVGALRLQVLWPDGPGSPKEDPNNHAIVLLASYGQMDVLLTADAESDVVARLPLRPVEVLKVAHHGSEDPGLADELRLLRPRVAVISVGRRNDYGHPRAETLAALEASPALDLYRTDERGRVVLESDGRTLSVRTERRP